MDTIYNIGLDIGTSSVKGVLMGASAAEPTAVVRVPFVYDTDASGKVEIPFDRYLESVTRAVRELAAAVPDGGRLYALCAGAASGNLLLLDAAHQPITPIIGWQDSRTDTEVAAVLGADFDYEDYYRSTGWGFDQKTFPLATLCRLKIREPALLKSAVYCAMSTEAMLWALCGSWGISTSAGTPFYLIDQQSGTYRTDLLARFGFTEASVPPVVPVGSPVGRVTAAAAARYGIPEGLTLIAGAFDHPSAARGVGITEPGTLLLSCGTSWVGFYPLNDRETGIRNHMLLDPFLSQTGDAWAGMVSLASVAGRIDDYIRLYIADGAEMYDAFSKAAAESGSGAGGLRLTLTAADDPELIRTYPKCHIARAIMECVIRMLDSDLRRLAEGGVHADSAVMVGGPTACPLWAEVIAEVTGLSVTMRHGAYAGAIGSASLCRR